MGELVDLRAGVSVNGQRVEGQLGARPGCTFCGRADIEPDERCPWGCASRNGPPPQVGENLNYECSQCGGQWWKAVVCVNKDDAHIAGWWTHFVCDSCGHETDILGEIPGP